MTNANSSAPKAMTADPSNPGQAALLGLLKQVLVALGTLLAGHGLIGPNNAITPENWQFIVGVVVAVAPVIWQAIDKYRVAQTVQEKERIAVQAALNFASIAQAEARPIPTTVSPLKAQAIIDAHS